MEISNFRFQNPVLSNFEYILNSEFDNNTVALDLGVNIDVNVSKSEDELKAVVEVVVKIGKKDNTTPFYIEVAEGAVFEWDDVYTEKQVHMLLNQNAPALLIGYVRPLVATITSASPYPTYNLPYINLTK